MASMTVWVGVYMEFNLQLTGAASAHNMGLADETWITHKPHE